MLGKPTDTGSALSLALGSRLAIKALIALQNQATPDVTLKAALEDAVTSLDAIRTGGPLLWSPNSSIEL